MSQRLKAGFSWPGLAVAAGEPFDVMPCVKRTCSFSGLALCVSSLPGLGAPLWSRDWGVGHAAIRAASSNVVPECPVTM